jgi:acetylornithine deacetylase/succinyl-diaminopimelate desuccinylase-like protein
MVRRLAGIFAFSCLTFGADENLPLSDRVVRYLSDLVRLDTSNPPGNETRVADYLKQVAQQFGIPVETMGPDLRRLNVVARLRGSGKGRPLMLFAQSDTSGADKALWTFDPFSGEVKGGFIHGRGSKDTKALLAAELAVFVEIKRRNIPLNRDLILCVEADGSGSSGMQWMMQNQWSKIDSEFALGEGGYSFDADGRKIHLVQVAEKLPLRITLTARNGGATRTEGPLVRLSRALIKIVDSEQTVRLSPVTRRYFREMAKLTGYEWLTPLIARLDAPATAAAAAKELRTRSADFDALTHDTVLPLTMRGSTRAAPVAFAEAVVEVRRLPGESREEILSRYRALLGDTAGVEVTTAPGPLIPGADATSLNTAAFRSMQNVFGRLHPEDIVSPYLSLNPTGNSHLRSRGVAVYGLPLFGELSNAIPDERIASNVLQDGVELLWQIVLEIASGS